jgi:hypothetical protein
MIPQLLALLVGLATCGQPPPYPTFRDFYRANYHDSGGVGHWAGSRGEIASEVLKRLADAEADYIDYRLAVMEKCR